MIMMKKKKKKSRRGVASMAIGNKRKTKERKNEKSNEGEAYFDL
jgi:hypothetical protein